MIKRIRLMSHTVADDRCAAAWRARADWAYDAVNEVYFDDLDGLRARIAWFAEHFDGVGEDDLAGESWFVAVREEAL